MYNSEQDEALDFRIPVERNNEEVIYTRIKHFKPGFVHSIPLPRHCSGNILLRSDLQKNIDYHCERERTEIADSPVDENLETHVSFDATRFDLFIISILGRIV
mmetsp:Transcript_23519/g.26685  ORF Transcript_23519/g.26685 Transcript_23519/m.26685 type:complete len:103 (+) Transcript_23519:348-656(+)